jgi:hypothetical protein
VPYRRLPPGGDYRPHSFRLGLTLFNVASALLVFCLCFASVLAAGVTFTKADYPEPPSGLDYGVDFYIRPDDPERLGGVTIHCPYLGTGQFRTTSGELIPVTTGYADLFLTWLDSETKAQDIFREISSIALWENAGFVGVERTAGRITGVFILDESVVDELEPITHEVYMYSVYANYFIEIQTAAVGEAPARAYLDYLEKAARALAREKGLLAQTIPSATTVAVPSSGAPSTTPPAVTTTAVSSTPAAGSVTTAIASATLPPVLPTTGAPDDTTGPGAEDGGSETQEENGVTPGEAAAAGAAVAGVVAVTSVALNLLSGATIAGAPVGADGAGADTGEEAPAEEKPQDNFTEICQVDGVSILRDMNTGKVMVAGSKIGFTRGNDVYGVLTAGGKVIHYNTETGEADFSDGAFTFEQKGGLYTITSDGKVLAFNPSTGSGTVSDGHYSFEKDGDYYMVTKDNWVIAHKGDKTSVSDGAFTFLKDNKTYTVTKDNMVIEYDAGEGEGKITDGVITFQKEGKVYSVTAENKVIEYNPESRDGRVTDGSFVFQKEGSVYCFTKDNKLIRYDTDSGNATISDGSFTFTRDGTTYAVTKDNLVVQYDSAEGNGKVSVGQFTIENQGKLYTVTKDGTVVSYDTASRTGSIASSKNTFIFGPDREFGLQTSAPGNIGRADVTFYGGLQHSAPDAAGGAGGKTSWWAGIKSRNVQIEYRHNPDETLVTAQGQWKF